MGKKGEKNSEMIHGWVIDGKENMSIYLAEKGSLTASSLTKFFGYEDLSKEEKKKYYNLSKEDLKTLIPKKEYLMYLRKLNREERKAKRNKVGI